MVERGLCSSQKGRANANRLPRQPRPRALPPRLLRAAGAQRRAGLASDCWVFCYGVHRREQSPHRQQQERNRGCSWLGRQHSRNTADASHFDAASFLNGGSVCVWGRGVVSKCFTEVRGGSRSQTYNVWSTYPANCIYQSPFEYLVVVKGISGGIPLSR